MTGKIVKIGGAAGASIDSAIAVPQLLGVPGMNYLIFDYLGEGAMGLFAKLQQMDPNSGYMTDFIDVHVAPYMADIKAKGVKFIANAGALNPRGLAKALAKRAEEQGISLKIGVVDGDDLRDRVDELRAQNYRDMFSGVGFPETVLSINAYLGGFPIAAALAEGADIVVTGRVVDSALILGPLIHEFGWKPTDYQLLAAGTAAGHLLECGAQSTGGTFTDWQDVPDWAHAGYPVGECRADGSFVMTKPEGSGGLCSVGTVAEQLLYEVSDPQAYIVPDVVCDFSTAKLEQIGPDRVLVTNVTGYAPTATYKVCVTYEDGWRATSLMPIVGIDAPAKAERQAAAILERTREMLRDRNLGDFSMTHVEVLDGEGSYGARRHGNTRAREAICKVAVEHDDKRAVDLFWREQFSAMMNMSVGSTIGSLSGFGRGPGPVTRMFSFLIDKPLVRAQVQVDERDVPFEAGRTAVFQTPMLVRPPAPPEPTDAGGDHAVPLISLAWARSGDKGDLFNVGVIARKAEYLPYIRAALTPEAVKDWYAQFDASRVLRYDLPGFNALNFVVNESLAGGINNSPRLDAAAKGMGQHLLEFPVPVSPAIAAALGR
ncbi:MAG TPA: acyclic terpene utilization AtuA family protein [Alphaproteobacteria bacterium]|nr:acyclic terpene utilization AtuA family protein [Alphaproteobacteria bacterium]